MRARSSLCQCTNSFTCGHCCANMKPYYWTPNDPAKAKPVPDPRIADYVAEVSQPGIPYISTSHNTLHRLNCEHGREVIQGLLDAHWEAVRKS